MNWFLFGSQMPEIGVCNPFATLSDCGGDLLPRVSSRQRVLPLRSAFAMQLGPVLGSNCPDLRAKSPFCVMVTTS
jgi:hypothetical protein